MGPDPAVLFVGVWPLLPANIGLPLLESVEASEGLPDGEDAMVDLASGRIEGNGRVFQARPIPDFMAKLIDAGGLVEYIRKEKIEK